MEERSAAILQAAEFTIPERSLAEWADLYLELGTPVSYKAGVTVTDAQDGELTFTVDSDGFDNKTAGRYTVYYSAEDNTTVIYGTKGELRLYDHPQ